MVLQFTGLSGAGKTSIAKGAKQLLETGGFATEVMDGDQYRQTICKGLGFSREDRCENIRRLGMVAGSFSRLKIVAIISAINPYEHVRRELKALYGAKTIWIDCPLNVLMTRDTKGLYRRALLPDDHPHKLNNLTGINDAYEAPVDADLIIRTDQEPLQQSITRLVDFVLAEMKR